VKLGLKACESKVTVAVFDGSSVHHVRFSGNHDSHTTDTDNMKNMRLSSALLNIARQLIAQGVGIRNVEKRMYMFDIV
jgi:hypothetical protein